MASRSSATGSNMAHLADSDLLPFEDILRFFNNPINEEQAWAVCFQCAQYYLREQSQEKYQELFEYGLRSVCLNREGEVHIHIRSGGPNGSGKGPPGGDYYALRKRHATEHDAVQALGRIIFEALDYGIGEAEERPLSHGLETLIETMTRSGEDSEGTDNESQSADDEGIEKDAEEDHHCTFRDVARLCTQHLSSRQDATYHYRAVCRALVAEAVELQTFLEKVSTSREKLQNEGDDDPRLMELERADWARLWVQVMRSLRQGVRLKKKEHVSHPPFEYELTPFEMLLEDIRSRRYTLHKIMVNGDIPPKVKNDAHAVILDFIRSRPPLRQVKDRKLKSLPPKPPDPHERLLQDIRAQPKLRPVKDGRLVVETSRTKVNSETESPPPLRKVIKPDFSLLLSSSFEESEEDSELDSPERPSRRRLERSRFSPLSSPAKDTMNATWHSSQTHTSLTHVPATGYDTRTKLQRRHTIMVCESPTDAKHAVQELPPLEEEEEPSPSEEQTPRLQRGADSPLSGLPDHTLHNGTVTLRNSAGGGPSAGRHQGALYRSEHRRSLTSGLTAIPENEVAEEGSGGGCDNSAAFPNRRHSLPASTQRRDVTSRGHGVGAVKSSAAGYGSGGGGGSRVSGGVASRGGRKHDAHGGGRPKSQPPPLKHCHGSGGDRSWSKHGEDSCEDEGDLALLNASEMLHKRWQNPIECLSLTLEEVTHIRSVLTKAELESLISHPDLYNQVAKSKVCFTCKTTRFTLFGEWGTKCKFCKRTVCSKCMRKMHVPTEHFKNIPVYTLSPTPLTKEAQELIQNYVKTTPPSSAPSTTTSQRKSLLEQQKGKRPLKRSQSMTLPTKKDSAVAASTTASATTTRGPMMSICCDCKGMIMEIIRASKTSLAMLQPGQAGSVAGTPDSASSMSLSSPSSESSETSNC